ncbi:hypothetical protein GCM10020331_090540 [Ectobacillus funiculus]
MRHAMVASPSSDLSKGRFQTVLEQPNLGQDPNKVKRLVLTTGKKMAIDLAMEAEAHKENEILDAVHIIRIEQLYPFPKEKVATIVKRYPNLEEIVWVQEEPKIWGLGIISPLPYSSLPASI